MKIVAVIPSQKNLIVAAVALTITAVSCKTSSKSGGDASAVKSTESGETNVVIRDTETNFVANGLLNIMDSALGIERSDNFTVTADAMGYAPGVPGFNYPLQVSYQGRVGAITNQNQIKIFSDALTQAKSQVGGAPSATSGQEGALLTNITCRSLPSGSSECTANYTRRHTEADWAPIKKIKRFALTKQTNDMLYQLIALGHWEKPESYSMDDGFCFKNSQSDRDVDTCFLLNHLNKDISGVQQATLNDVWDRFTRIGIRPVSNHKYYEGKSLLQFWGLEVYRNFDSLNAHGYAIY